MGLAPLPSRIIVGPGGPALSGDVTLVAGNNSRLDADQVGKRIIVSNPTPGIPRSIEVFTPGTPTAITIGRFAIPQAVLTRMDINAKTAPGGTTDATNHWNVQVAGSQSGLATLGLQVAGTADYHLGIGDLSTSVANNTRTPGGNRNEAALAFLVRPTAALSLAGMDATFITTPGDGSWTDPDLLIGLCDADQTATVANDLPKFQAAAADSTKLPWLTDRNGNPCYTRLPRTAIGAGMSIPAIFSGIVDIPQFRYFYVVVAKVFPPAGSFGFGLGTDDDATGRAWTGSVSAGSQGLFFAGNGAGWIVNGSPSTAFPTRLFGTLNGLNIGGQTVVSLVVSGTGGTVLPADINVSLEV